MDDSGILTLKALAIWRARVGWESYYDILGVPPDADAASIKGAFHRLALKCHPDQYVDAEPGLAAAAAEVFKRGVEAYRALSDAEVRTKYDEILTKGRLRYVEGEQEEKPAPVVRTLEEIARTPRAKQFARKAERFIGLGRLDEARVAVITALQDDPDNEELQERLNILYEALALEPL